MGPIPPGFPVCKRRPKVQLSQWKWPLGAMGAEVGHLFHGCDHLLDFMVMSLGIGTVSSASVFIRENCVCLLESQLCL